MTNSASLERLLARLVEVIGPVRCELWFDEPGRVLIERDTVHFFFESEFESNRVQRNFGLAIRRCAQEIFGSGCRIRFGEVDALNLDGVGNSRSEGHKSPSANAAPMEKNPQETCGTQPSQASLDLPIGDAEHSLPKSCAPNSDSQHSKTSRLAVNGVGILKVQTGQAYRDKRLARRSGSPASLPVSNSLTGTTITSGKSLERFWFGAENELVQAAINQSIQNPGSFSPLLIFGPTGSGKSHLLDGIGSVYRNKLRLKRCVLMTAEEFTNSFVQALRGAGLPMFRKKFRDLDLLAIDDIQFLAGKRATITELQYTLDQLGRLGKQVVLTADRSPSELSQLSGELSARIGGGLNCPIRYPDMSGRRQIVTWMCEQRGFSLATDVVDVLASGVTRDCRRISGALNRLRALMLTTGNIPTAESARRDLADLLSDPRPATTLTRIEQVICEACGVTPPELRSDNRNKRISSARILAMWLSRQYTTNALSEIGEHFGGRSHSTVVSAQKRVDQWLQNDQKIEINSACYPLRDAVQILTRKLRVS